MIYKIKKMKIVRTGILFMLLSFTMYTESIYSHSVTTIEGGNQSLSAYQGKKLLIVTLPLQQTAATDSLLYSLDTLSAARSAGLQVVAVPAFEDGFTIAQKTSLQQWYRSRLGNQVIITDGLYTRKAAGAQQHPVFAWLTRLEKNENFDIDADAPGYKFFVSAAGQLVGVLRPHTKMSSMAVQRTLQL